MGWDSVVLWPALCQQENFWNYSQSVDSFSPDLTPCFQQTVLVWLPCGILWLCLPLYTPYLISTTSSYTRRGRSKVCIAKLVISVLLVLLAVLDLVRLLTAASDTKPPVTAAAYVEAAVRMATFIICALYIDMEFRAAVHSSGVFFIFWFLLVLCGIVPFRSKIMIVQANGGHVEDPFAFTTFYVSYGLALVMLTLTAFVSDRSPQPEVDEDERRPLLDGHDHVSKSRETTALPCPEDQSTFLSQLTNWWIISLLIKGFRRPLTFDDLYSVLPEDQSVAIFNKFSNEWGKQQRNSRPSLLRALVKTSLPQLFISIIFRFIDCFWRFVNPLVLPLVIDWVSGKDPYVWKGYGLAFLLLGVNLLTPTIQNLHTKYGNIMAFRVRTAVIATVYRKALRLSSGARRNRTVGEIVNLMSVDAQKVHDATEFIHEIWASPIMIVLALIMLWNTLGPSSLAAVGVYVLLAPIYGGLGVLFEKIQVTQMKQKDERIKLTNELLSGMKVLKMYAWEPPFASMITAVRQKELGYLRSQGLVVAGFTVAWHCGTILVPLAMFGVFILSNPTNILDPQTAFVTITLVGNLTWGAALLMYLPFYFEAYVSMKRISTFLGENEIDPYAIDHDAMSEYSIEVRQGSFSWGGESDRPVLTDIDLQVPGGCLLAVVGTVGVGKSSLISALLGELQILRGSVNVKGSVAYVPQQAWIQNKTLRSNILFNKVHRESRYNRVVEACALTADFAILPAGDQTEIGEKGINLSGGQKQRVSLARAVYQSSDVYLLDDPLSAVDAHVGKHIFDKVLGPEGLLRHSTRVLVTHAVTYLPRCDVIVVMRDGNISESGSYQELLGRNGAFADFLRQYLTELDEEQALQDPILKQLERQLSTLSEGAPDSPDKPSPLRQRISRIISVDKEVQKDKDQERHDKGNLIDEEEAAVGTVSISVVCNYLLAATLVAVLSLVVCSAVFVASNVGQSVWLSMWSDDPSVNGTEGRTQANFRLGVYAALGVVEIFASFGATLAILLGGVTASTTIHKRLLTCILRAPMSFFDTTPLGRILNRFSGDMDTVDTVVPNKFDYWLYGVFNVISTFIVICYSTPLFATVLIPVVIVYFTIQRAYVRSIRQLQRINSVRKSPIFVNFDETLVGVASVRAYGRQQEFIERNDRLVDDSSRAWYPILISRTWLSFFLDLLGAVIIFFATLFAVITRDSISGGLVGLSLSYSFTSTFLINMLVTQTSELETDIVSVERIEEYSNIESEAPWVVENLRPQDGWPEDGQLSFVDYSTRYRPGLDLVLRKINFSINRGEKVGVVGRTGAGKSSLALSLFRLIEPAEGSIVIDGLDITKVGLHDLRSRLTVIPQEPVLFSGSIRRNLDPFKVYSDDDIWTALEHAHLKSFISDLPSGLEHDVGEGGGALSVGQRQLVCLARALLRMSQVLILDEATAAVDLETDDLIQDTIRNKFTECTVITIAHRLNTIMDYDRVMVLDGGEIRELDNPATLLAKPESIFYGLAKDAGMVV